MDPVTAAIVLLAAPVLAAGVAGGAWWLGRDRRPTISVASCDVIVGDSTQEIIDRIDAELDAEYRKRFPIDPLRIR